ncbi:MAG: tetrahydrofolate dehydrogenase/cyclohydrolase catalytic domain-containing protein, partial [Candidatus Limnocylindrales bacterium]
MTAEQLLGGPVAAQIREVVADDVVDFVADHAYVPELAIVVVGADAPSMVYLRRILAACEKVGVTGRLVELEADCSESDLARTIEALGAEREVAGIIVQQPLPECIPLRV